MFNRHKKLAALAFILGSFLLVLAACQDGPAEPAGASYKALTTPDTVEPSDPAYIQARLAEMWAESDLMEYESFQGTIANPAAGGKILGSVPSWPGCTFSIEFRAGVLSGSHPQTFRMRVPRPDARGGVYYHFEQVGGSEITSFNGDAIVTIHWPASRKRASEFFNLSCLNRTDTDGDGVYEYSRTDERIFIQPNRSATQLVFRLPHFSRWSAQNGKVGEPS